MIVIQTIAVAFGMFSAVPMPQPVWNKRNMRYMLCAFPLVGALIGLLELLWCGAADLLHLSDLLRGAGCCLLPILVTGGIHLDGYADTSDALSSYGDQEKKQKILDDPHCGAFAVIRLLVYGFASFALSTAIHTEPTVLLGWALSFVLSRALSGFAVAAFPMAKDTGLAHTFASSADKRRVRLVLLAMVVVLSVGMVLASRWHGIAMLAAGFAALRRYHRVAMRQFGGISGDLAGWFLQKAELWMLAALIAVQTITEVV